MSENTETVEKPKAFVRIARKVVDRGNFKETSISIPVEVDPANIGADFWRAIDDVTTSANAAVLDALGIEYDVDPDSGKLVEKIVVPAPTVAQAEANVGAAFGGGGGDVPSCPKCGSDMWDNRLTKKNPRQPDFKCKEYKNGCDGAVWPPR